MNRKKAVIISAWFFLIGYRLFSQDIQEEILYIRDCFVQINQNLGTYDQTEYEDVGLNKDISPDRYSMESLDIYNLVLINCYKYSENGSAKKIIMTFIGPDETLISEYYIWNNQLIFVFKTMTTYLKPKWADDFSEDDKNVYENRFYIKNDKIIKWINAKKEIVSDPAQLQAEEEILIHDYKIYLTLTAADTGPLSSTHE